ncbi:hypothetical protein [Jiella sp. M17.18]|uniref:hypothetical protein n=1 Tax=Jiella sp. M17.18 TaxID=3234247 RepID=UPI0034DF54F6
MNRDEATAIFRSLMTLCGLDSTAVGQILGIHRVNVRHRMSGYTAVKPEEMDALADLWRRIDAGDDALTGAAAEHARAIQWVRERVRNGHKGD